MKKETAILLGAAAVGLASVTAGTVDAYIDSTQRAEISRNTNKIVLPDQGRSDREFAAVAVGGVLVLGSLLRLADRQGSRQEGPKPLSES